MTRVRSKAAPRSGRTRPSAHFQASDETGRPLKIGEAARAVGVEPYVLRFWETQFTFLRPKHSRSKHRFYEASDIETLRLVKRLLHTEGYTIAGARKHITDLGLDRLLDGTSPAEVEPSPPVVGENHTGDRIGEGSSMRGRLTEIRDDLRSLHKLLEH
jgi:DNA-binding transcriptional MerR regulator